MVNNEFHVHQAAHVCAEPARWEASSVECPRRWSPSVCCPQHVLLLTFILMYSDDPVLRSNIL